MESGVNFSLALNRDGKVYVWGDNKFGQLGTGSLKSVYDPTPLDELYREKVVDISCGDNYAGAVTEDGKVYTWGFGNEGQLGHGDKSDQFLPRKINLSSKISRISCGGAHTALLTDNGKLFMMGRGREGQLGREVKDEGSSGYSLLLKLVEQLPTNKKITKVRCGTTHTMTLME